MTSVLPATLLPATGYVNQIRLLYLRHHALSLNRASLFVVALLSRLHGDFPCLVKLTLVRSAFLFDSTIDAFLDIALEANG